MEGTVSLPMIRCGEGITILEGQDAGVDLEGSTALRSAGKTYKTL